ncbi:unnamed protein product [Musa hybrid cultivar]
MDCRRCRWRSSLNRLMKASATSLMSSSSSSSAAKRFALLALSSATRGCRPASPLPGNKAAAEGLFLLLLPLLDVGLRSSGADAILASTTTEVAFELPPMVRSFPTIWRPISSSSKLSVAWTSALEMQTSAACRSRWKPEAR